MRRTTLAGMDFMLRIIAPKRKFRIEIGKGAEMIELYLSSASDTSLTLNVASKKRIPLLFLYIL